MSIVDFSQVCYNSGRLSWVVKIMIRLFALTDLDRILEIEQHSFPKSPYPGSTFLQLFRLYPKTFWVYVEQPKNEPLGEICGYLIFSEQGHLFSIAIHPDSRRKGIAKTLLQKARAALPNRSLWAEVRRSNPGALAFYQTVGFRILGVLSNYYGDEDALIVQWPPPSQ
jgi:ribosomal protein S18 acetylase RimI-like enzyme